MLIDPVAHQAADDALVPPWLATHVATQAAEVFQSSRTSWSSKIIDTGTVESTHRTTGSAQASR